MNVNRLAVTAAVTTAVGGLGLTGVAAAGTTARVSPPTHWVHGWYCGTIAQPNPVPGVDLHWGWHKIVGQTVATVSVAALLASGCGVSAEAAAASGHASGPKVMIRTRVLPGVGRVLVDARGYALYMFERDRRRHVTCTGACPGTWPPLKLPAGAVPAAGPGVKRRLLGSDPDPSGGRVITYAGWPLYTYAGDVGAGEATGQAIDLNGGEWYVLRPSGAPLIPSPRS